MHFPLASVSLAAVLVGGVYTCVPTSMLPASLGGTSADAQPTSLEADPQPALVVETLAADLEVPVLRTGLSPQFLAASGASSGSVNAVLNAAADDLGDCSALDSADAAYSSARQTRDTLQRLVQSGLGTEEDATSLAAAETALTSATAARDAILGSARAAGAAELTSTQQATLSSLLSNRDRRLPIEFLVLDLEAADWITLRNALDDEKAAPKLGLEPNAELQSFLTAKRAVTAVATAKSNLDSNLTAIQAAWDATFTD
ncbi:MAG: hypothetical protein H6716_22795 [Polyangiaceae bacterium]|nr:hypothetical protein [Polyangiaceae bacterium]